MSYPSNLQLVAAKAVQLGREKLERLQNKPAKRQPFDINPIEVAEKNLEARKMLLAQFCGFKYYDPQTDGYVIDQILLEFQPYL